VSAFLGLDIGTSSVKAVVVDADDRVLAQASESLNVQRPMALWSEQDPKAWWIATVRTVRQLPESVRRTVQSVGLAGQMHGAVLLDERDVPLRPAILWNDGRSARECLELERREPRMREITGNMAMPGFTAPKLLWVRAHEPEIFKRTRTVLLPKDYVRLCLTGEKVSDPSDASGTLWLDVARREWSEAMLEACGLTRQHMPEIVEGSMSSGLLTDEAASLLGIPSCVVAGGGGDNAASAVGSGVVAPGQGFLSLGTSGVIFTVADRLLANPARAVHAFCHCLPKRWHQMAVMLSAASSLTWAVKMMGYSNITHAVSRAKERQPRRDAPIFLPYLAGERTPHNDPYARGVFFGITLETRRADLIGAVLEGVAFGLADGLDALQEAGSSPSALDVCGGASRFDYWCELLASTLNRTLVRRIGAEVGAAAGAARLGRLVLSGEEPSVVCRAPPIERVFEPNPHSAAWLSERRAVFSKLYRNVKDLFKDSQP